MRILVLAKPTRTLTEASISHHLSHHAPSQFAADTAILMLACQDVNVTLCMLSCCCSLHWARAQQFRCPSEVCAGTAVAGAASTGTA